MLDRTRLSCSSKASHRACFWSLFEFVLDIIISRDVRVRCCQKVSPAHRHRVGREHACWIIAPRGLEGQPRVMANIGVKYNTGEFAMLPE